MNKELKKKFETALFKVLEVPSVQGKATADAPFGEDVKKALDVTLSIAEELGFETKNYDNYIGEVIWGEGKPFGVLCHLDVVPAGSLSAWETDPFTPTVKDGKLFCRGALDDKSAAISVLFAMYALKEEGFKPKRQIKLILGCNEESGWGCIKHYNEVAVMPEEGISPDADFPVIYAEKGILHAKFTFKALSNELKELSGGERINVVCDKCEAIAPLNPDLMYDCQVKRERDKLVARGVQAHGSTPEKGDNAIYKMVKYLEKIGMIDSRIREYLFEDKLGLKELHDETGYLTMSPDVVTMDGDNINISVDFRYPSLLNGEKLIEALKLIAPVEILSHQLPLFNDKQGFLVTTLLNVYNEETGENKQPIAIGGGTYARALKYGTAFGPEEEGVDCHIHQPNEFVSIKNLELQCKIYKRAIKELSK